MTQKRNYRDAYFATKTALFESCYKAYNLYEELFKIEGFDSTTYCEKIKRLSAFVALYSVIESAGLEDHYQAWKEANKEV